MSRGFLYEIMHFLSVLQLSLHVTDWSMSPLLTLSFPSPHSKCAWYPKQKVNLVYLKFALVLVCLVFKTLKSGNYIDACQPKGNYFYPLSVKTELFYFSKQFLIIVLCFCTVTLKPNNHFFGFSDNVWFELWLVDSLFGNIIFYSFSPVFICNLISASFLN